MKEETERWVKRRSILPLVAFFISQTTGRKLLLNKELEPNREDEIQI